MPDPSPTSAGLLGDTAGRDYAGKLRTFARFAQPELRQAIASLALRPGMRILDAGCGTGEALHWLAEAVGPGGSVLGIDLSHAHVAAARSAAPPGVEVMQADLGRLELAAGSFDLIWCVNTLNHFREPLDTLARLSRLLKACGRIAVGQSGLLAEMFFAWDSRLERLVSEAVRSYYRDRYALEEKDLASIRSIAGLLHGASLRDVTARTFTIERLSPLDGTARQYLQETIFRDTWGERLRPYLNAEDYATLAQLCDPEDQRFALDRPDFHFIQTFTLATGTKHDHA